MAVCGRRAGLLVAGVLLCGQGGGARALGLVALLVEAAQFDRVVLRRRSVVEPLGRFVLVLVASVLRDAVHRPLSSHGFHRDHDFIRVSRFSLIEEKRSTSVDVGSS